MLSTRDADAVAAAFGLGSEAVLSGPVARGEMGQVWRLDTVSGRFAVKVPFDPPSAAEVAADAAFQDAAHAAGVPMPSVVRTIEGEALATIGSCIVRVYEWVDLLTVDRWIDPAAVGRVVANIHRVHHTGTGPVHWWYSDPVGAARWDELVGELRAAGAPFAGRLACIRDELVALEGLLEPAAVLQTCHRDLFADNVLATASGDLCVIDWENSGLADPSHELAVVLVDFACGDPGRALQLYGTYLDAGGPGRLRRPGDFSMAIAQLGHIGERACRLWLDPAEDRDRALARVHEFIDEPITRLLIAELLDAI